MSEKINRDCVRDKHIYTSYLYSRTPTPPPLRPCTPSPPLFSHSPYVNYIWRASGINTTGTTIAGNDDSDTAPQKQAPEATMSSTVKRDAVLDSRKRAISNKILVYDDEILSQVQDCQSFGRKPRGHEKYHSKNIVDKLVNNMAMTRVESNQDEQRKKDSGRGWRRGKLSSVLQDSVSPSNLTSNGEEFFDAPDAPLDDSTSDEESLRWQRNARLRRNTDAIELRLGQEIKRRIAAEDAMAVLQQRYTEMAHCLACNDMENCGSSDAGQNVSNTTILAQKLVVAQVVAASVARGAARAEVGELASVVADKDREIARLRGKLQYLELVNHEMSQRNQEAIDTARTLRHRRRYQHGWVMGCVGTALCVGLSATLVYEVVPWATWQLRVGPVLQHHLCTEKHQSPLSLDM